jgi:DNA polymerase-4
MQLFPAYTERPRHILHVNTDDFFASLARLRDSSLRERPVIVGHLLNRGSVVSASYEARAAGVHPGLTMQQAARRLPDAALVQVDWAYARRASRELLRILETCSPRIEASRVDEAFVDYTGCERLFGTPLDVGRRLQRQVQERVGLEVSIGVAANKLVSRFASSSAKRHSLLDVLPGYEAHFVAPQPVERLPGVGGTLGRKLRDMGVPTVGELAAFPPEVLEGVFGVAGRRLAESARGIDSSPVMPARHQVGLEESETFDPDLLRWDDLEARLDGLCTRLGTALRWRRCTARSLGMELEYSDRLCVRRGCRFRATHLDGALFAAARPTLAALYVRRVRVRRLLLRAGGLEPASVQLDLFRPDGEARLRRLMQASDQVRQRYGGAPVLLRGRALLGSGGGDDFAGPRRLG